MAEYINKEDVIRKIVETSAKYSLDPGSIAIVLSLIEKMPSKDFTEVDIGVFLEGSIKPFTIPVKRHTNKGEL